MLTATLAIEGGGFSGMHEAFAFPQLPEDYTGSAQPPIDPPSDGEDPVPPAAPQCPYPFYYGTIEKTGEGGVGDSGVPDQPIAITRYGESLSCLTSLIDDIHEECNRLIGNGGYCGSAACLDDCYAQTFAELFAGSMVQMNQSGTKHWFFFDENCMPVDDFSWMVAPCDAISIEWWLSPISLLLDDSTSFDSEVSFAKFPLDPRTPDAWYVWKASASAPLLVYDPEHTGVITSAEQLFGNWTFGGQRVASLSVLSDVQSVSTGGAQWENGYEALATLDADRDGAVSGAELEDLALWSDNNRDGISQPGEVKRLDEVGITRLFYDVDNRDEATGSIYATRGFERVIDGRATIGRSVDWYGESGSSKAELVSRQFARGLGCNSDTGGEIAKDEAHQRIEEEPIHRASDVQTNDAIKGVWLWKVDDYSEKGGTPPVGVLLFQLSADGALTGVSLGETNFNPGAHAEVKTMVSKFELSDIVVRTDGSRQIDFRIAGQSGNVTSTAKLSSDGRTLHGQSRAELRSDSGKEFNFTYKWTARKSGIK
jgi:hypothetical protein